MNFLDMRTVVFSYMLMQVLCAMVIWDLWRANRQRYSGISFWLAGYLAQVAGLLLVLLRGHIPALLSFAASHVSMLSGIILMRCGIGRFLKKDVSLRLDGALLAVFIFAQYYFYRFQPSLDIRNINLNLAILALSLECVWTLAKDTAPALRRIVLPAVSAFTALGVLSVLRISYSLHSPIGEDLFTAGGLHSLLMLGYVMLVLALTFGLILVVNHRLLEDTKADFERRVKAEESGRDSEERFQKAFKAAPVLMSLSEVATGRYIEVNDKFCQVTGFTREELIGRTSTEIGWINKEARDSLIKNSNGLSARIPEITLHAKGEKPVVCSYACELVRLGEQNIMLAIAEDITERKTAEAALNEGEARFKLVVESAPEAIFVQSAGKFAYLNPACCALFGVSGQEALIGTDFMDRMAPEFRDAIRKRIKLQVESGGPAPLMEQKFLRMDGSVIDVETTAVPVRFGGRDSHLVFVRNITERKRAEAEILRAQKMESVGVLAGGIAHDFNNMLTGISGNLSLINAAAGTGGEIPELVKEAELACLTAKGLARQLLTFASGGEPVKEVLELGALIKESVSFALRGSNAGSAVKLEGGPLHTHADKDQLLQVLQNLVINAAQAMPGGGTITVTAAAVELGEGEVTPLEAGSYARVEVADSGAGIPPEILPHLFEPYFSTKGKGRGLGLAVCRSVIVKHGGQIGVRSEPGKGAVFTIHLPLTDEVRQVPAQPQAQAAAKGKGRVLVMDDEEVVRKTLKRMLTALGYEAELTANGEQALAAWETAMKTGRPFTAAIIDLTIAGGMGGARAITKLIELDPSAKAIVSSGYADSPVISQYREYGFSGVLPKPYKLEELAAAIAALTPGR
jgi:PAS domain S-box-containing protein